MQQLVLKYKHDNHFDDLRTIEIDGVLWFVATDVANLLGYTNPSKAILDHCKEKGITKRYPLKTGGGIQYVNIINEGNVYRLITKSKLPSAEKFEEWLFEEVLPSIRKNGSYGDAINRFETPNFIKRYFENFDKVDRGYFSVINMLYVCLYARLEHAGYKIPNKGTAGKEIRPDVSVGLRFAAYLQTNFPQICDNYKKYPHTINNVEVEARQYPIDYVSIFIKYVDDIWIPTYAEDYFKQRDRLALEFLPKLLNAS